VSLSRSCFVLVSLLFVLLLAAAAPAAASSAVLDINQVYVPLVARSPMPIGMVVGTSELYATQVLARQGVEPSRRAVKSLLDNADEALAVEPCAVARYTAADVDCLNRASENSYALALAFYVTGDGRYAAKAAEFIRGWSSTLVAIDPEDDQNQLGWSRVAPAMIWAADLLEGTPGWTDGDRRLFADMLHGKVLDIGKGITNRPNNWADAGDLVWLSIALYADLPDERADAVASWKLKLDGVLQPDGAWESGMAPDGSLPEENRRVEKGLQYNQGALSLKTVFAEMLRRQGDASLYTYTTPRGVGLKNGWDFLAPHVTSAYNHENSGGPCTWPYTADHCVDYANKSAWEIAYARWHVSAYMGPIMLDRPYQWSNAADPSYSTLLFGNLSIGQ